MIDIDTLLDFIDDFSLMKYINHKKDGDNIMINFETKKGNIATFNVPPTRAMLILRLYNSINDFYNNDKTITFEEDELRR